MNEPLFTPVYFGPLQLKNRFIRAATYEGMGTTEGIPTAELQAMYTQLAREQVGLIITGFNHFTPEGRAMQPRQCGIESDQKIEAWKKITDAVHQEGGKIALQLAHTGRQSIKTDENQLVWAPSSVRCTYFRSKPKQLSEAKIEEIIEEFAQAGYKAKLAGFDAVQIHCAHGYLIHQFFSPHTNRRRDRWGGSLANRARFAIAILNRTRELCGKDFAILIKLSAADDRKLKTEETISIAKLIEENCQIDGIEISYGTMEFALNIIRGGIPLHIALKHNPLFNRFPSWLLKVIMKFYYPYYLKKITPFCENYNLQNARPFVRELKTPVVLTGGIRDSLSMKQIIDEGFAALSLSRPFLAEPNLIQKIKDNDYYHSRCTNCNLCTMYCDSMVPIRCFAFTKL